MTNPPITEEDGCEVSVPERLEQAARFLREHPDSMHPELWKLLSLAVYRTARLGACEAPEWGHVASAYLTLSTLGVHLSVNDYFGQVPPPVG